MCHVRARLFKNGTISESEFAEYKRVATCTMMGLPIDSLRVSTSTLSLKGSQSERTHINEKKRDRSSLSDSQSDDTEDEQQEILCDKKR